MPRKTHKGKAACGCSSPRTEKDARESVSREVAALGKQVAETLRAVAESDELRAVKSELTTSMKRVSAKVLDAVKTAGKSERPKAVAQQLGKVAESGRKRGMEASERLRTNLSKGLREIGQELSRLAQRLNH